MKNIFCTLVTDNYLLRGLSLYDSLKRNMEEFYLYILCMDDKTYNILNSFKLDNVILISLFEFEDEELKKVKQKRQKNEYCWTCKASLLLYILKKYKHDLLTYLDADLYFYSSSKPIFEEFDQNSILITDHKYTASYNQTKTAGRYNAQFITIRNDEHGIACLNWWRDRCLEWCYAYLEGNKWADQKYLEQWPGRFKKVYVVKNIGAGAAPWNINNYKVKLFDNKVYVNDISLIFFHFHNLDIYKNKFCLVRGYNLEKEVIANIYLPYVKKIREIEKRYFVNENIDFCYKKDSFKIKMARLIRNRFRREICFYEHD